MDVYLIVPYVPNEVEKRNSKFQIIEVEDENFKLLKFNTDEVPCVPNGVKTRTFYISNGRILPAFHPLSN